MNISEKFKKLDWFPRLGRRGPNFAAMIAHVESFPSGLIVETGTAHDRDNFEGQGQSTLIWDWLLDEKKELRAFSLEIRPEAIETAKSQTKNMAFILGDSVKSLSEFLLKDNIALLYLDSYDWTAETNLESATHHLFELAAVYASLRPGAMIVVDDRHGDFKGKHWLVELFFTQLGVKPAFKNCQIGWIKP